MDETSFKQMMASGPVGSFPASRVSGEAKPTKGTATPSPGRKATVTYGEPSYLDRFISFSTWLLDGDLFFAPITLECRRIFTDLLRGSRSGTGLYNIDIHWWIFWEIMLRLDFVFCCVNHEYKISYDILGVHLTCNMGSIRETNEEREK